MSSFIVSGARPLFGEIRAGGCKNAVLPVVFATVATRGRSVIRNAPDIIDLTVATELVRSLGASVERRGTDLYIDSSSLTPQEPDPALLSRIRASTYLLGASLAAFGRVSVAPSGGCSFAARPIDLHIFAFERMGARFFSVAPHFCNSR